MSRSRAEIQAELKEARDAADEAEWKLKTAGANANVQSYFWTMQSKQNRVRALEDELKKAA